MAKPEEPEVVELNDEPTGPSRSKRDRRAIDFYKHYTSEELKQLPPDRRRGDRRQPPDKQG